jgi:hypothetical protein
MDRLAELKVLHTTEELYSFYQHNNLFIHYYEIALKY